MHYDKRHRGTRLSRTYVLLQNASEMDSMKMRDQQLQKIVARRPIQNAEEPASSLVLIEASFVANYETVQIMIIKRPNSTTCFHIMHMASPLRFLVENPSPTR